MINNLKDFKNSTKRIQSILQTFEIKTPEAFRLSNSASLNFMARILGYENYNTIKSVLENNISKENKMKLIKFESNRHFNIDKIEELDIQKSSYIGNEYEVRIITPEDIKKLATFKNEKDAQNLYDKIIEFLFNDEKVLDLEEKISKINNVDNRANQLNPNLT